MRIKLIFFFLSFFLTLPVSAGEVSESDFKADTTEQIVNLCTANADDPLYHQAVNFCHGYLVGRMTITRPPIRDRKRSDWSACPNRRPPAMRPLRCSSIGPRRIRST